MVTFLDGPAIGVSLLCRWAPPLVRGKDGAWDALDCSNDQPKLEETITVYRIVGEVGSVHLQIAGKGGRRCGYYARAEYAVLDVQPDDETCRSARKWTEWMKEQEAKEV